jgi:hypothetical protein
MKFRKNIKIEREAVNATQAFLEANNCIFQENNLQNDYGKDAYVDFVDNENVTGICAALQIKGGVSYKRENDYFIPIEDHLEVWQNSTLPIIGIVYDPEDKNLRWCNISNYLDNIEGKVPSRIPVNRNSILTPTTLHFELKTTIIRFNKLHRMEHPIIRLYSNSLPIKLEALADCFALGRSDSRVLIALRYLIKSLTGEPFFTAIYILSHLTNHPDIFWNSKNWIPDNIISEVKPHLIWDIDEIRYFLTNVTWDLWQRGNDGENLYMLLVQDPDIKSKIETLAVESINNGEEDVAWATLYLSIYWADKKGFEKYEQMLSQSKDFEKLSLSGELVGLLKEFGYVTLFE